jgi:hypothetical protein
MYVDHRVPLTVEKVTFLIAYDYKLQNLVDLGLPKDMLLCVVNLRGRFFRPTLPGETHKGSPTIDTAWQLFDARTGNLMVEGLGPGK